MLVIVTETPGSTPPLSSETVPLMLPYTACAAVGAALMASTTAVSSISRIGWR
jgi:hypothetical protein